MCIFEEEWNIIWHKFMPEINVVVVKDQNANHSMAVLTESEAPRLVDLKSTGCLSFEADGSSL